MGRWYKLSLTSVEDSLAKEMRKKFNDLSKKAVNDHISSYANNPTTAQYRESLKSLMIELFSCYRNVRTADPNSASINRALKLSILEYTIGCKTQNGYKFEHEYSVVEEEACCSLESFFREIESIPKTRWVHSHPVVFGVVMAALGAVIGFLLGNIC